ncbi:site-specific integrase, partial [Weissella viridescens]|uniref:site-specific integrase n=2 Tax=Weissella TaxID=46255 RepID=UPI003AA8333C
IQQYAYFRLMSYTGLRRGEILALEWQDIDFQKKRLTVNKSIGYDSLDGSGNLYLKGTKTVASNRTISVDTTTLEIMTEYRKALTNNSGNEPVWPKKFNKKTKWMAANIPEIWLLDMRKDEHADDDLKRVSLHGLRHTHATVLFEQAMLNNQQIPIKAVQKRLGHANVNVTMEIYTHMTDTENDVINSFLENGIE